MPPNLGRTVLSHITNSSTVLLQKILHFGTIKYSKSIYLKVSLRELSGARSFPQKLKISQNAGKVSMTKCLPTVLKLVISLLKLKL